MRLGGALLDHKIMQERLEETSVGPGLYASREATRSAHDCKMALLHTGGPWFGMGCDVHYDDAICGKRGRVTYYYSFEVTDDDKLLLKRDVSERRGERCRPNDGSE